MIATDHEGQHDAAAASPTGDRPSPPYDSAFDEPPGPGDAPSPNTGDQEVMPPTSVLQGEEDVVLRWEKDAVASGIQTITLTEGAGSHPPQDELQPEQVGTSVPFVFSGPLSVSGSILRTTQKLV